MLMEDARIVQLYWDRDEQAIPATTEPILYAALSKSSAAVTFSNLTSATSYKVAGKISSGTAPVTLKITD